MKKPAITITAGEAVHLLHMTRFYMNAKAAAPRSALFGPDEISGSILRVHGRLRDFCDTGVANKAPTLKPNPEHAGVWRAWCDRHVSVPTGGECWDAVYLYERLGQRVNYDDWHCEHPGCEERAFYTF